MRHKQNPASGKHIRSQGSFYYNVKIISRRFSFTLRRGGCCRPLGTQSVSLNFSAQRAEYNHLLPLTYYFLLQLLPPAGTLLFFQLYHICNRISGFLHARKLNRLHFAAKRFKAFF